MNDGIIVIAATNRPDVLDPALQRPGRFDRQVVVPLPDIRGREQILKVHAKNVTLGSDVELSKVAARTPGFAGADLANLVNEAALLAARRGKPAVDMTDFDEALDRIVGGLEKKNRVMNAKEKETIAYHEAGHAIVAEHRPLADRVSKVSIIPRGIAALGYTQQTPTEDRYLMTVIATATATRRHRRLAIRDTSQPTTAAAGSTSTSSASTAPSARSGLPPMSMVCLPDSATTPMELAAITA